MQKPTKICTTNQSKITRERKLRSVCVCVLQVQIKYKYLPSYYRSPTCEASMHLQNFTYVCTCEYIVLWSNTHQSAS